MSSVLRSFALIKHANGVYIGLFATIQRCYGDRTGFFCVYIRIQVYDSTHHSMTFLVAKLRDQVNLICSCIIVTHCSRFLRALKRSAFLINAVESPGGESWFDSSGVGYLFTVHLTLRVYYFKPE